MSRKSAITKIPRCFLIRISTIFLVIICSFSSLNSQSKEGYSISWVDQFPPDRAVETTSFKDRLSELVFGQKPMHVIKPFSIVAFHMQHYWILDQGAGTVLRYRDGEGEIMKPMRKANMEFPSLVGMTLLPGGEILCTDSRLNQVFHLHEEKLSLFSESISLNQPTGIAFLQQTGEVWIVETGAHHLTVVNQDGKLIRKIGGRGSGPGNFNYPTFIWIDRAGRVYIVDSMNFRVQVLDHHGKFLFAFGENGNATGYMARPKGVATDSKGNIYVADALFHVVQIFDCEGNFLYTFGSQGSETGAFWMPAGIFIDEQDFIYVADSYNSRVQVFQLVKN